MGLPIVGGACVEEHCKISLPLCAESEVIPHHNVLGMKTLTEKVANESLRRHLCQRCPKS
jgi:hypothetical protein